MALTWKDAATTVLAGGTGMLAYAKYQNLTGWFTAPRLGVLTLGVVGIVMCATGAVNDAGSTLKTALSILGGLAAVLVLVGLITGSSVVFYALAADILALWLLTTMRHLTVAA
jgi:hypothetical protein